MVDAYPSHQIKDFLNTEMYYFKVRREESERVLRTMAEICPAFGMVGSVVGLISMLTGVGDSAVILATVPIALTSTLYGVVLANFFFLPFAASIRQRTNRELLLQKIITDAVLAIESEVNPRVLEMKLKSFLTPSSRQGRLVSLERIQKKFRIKPQPKEPSSASTFRLNTLRPTKKRCRLTACRHMNNMVLPIVPQATCVSFLRYEIFSQEKRSF